jgi:hypothetical protein
MGQIVHDKKRGLCQQVHIEVNAPTLEVCGIGLNIDNGNYFSVLLKQILVTSLGFKKILLSCLFFLINAS